MIGLKVCLPPTMTRLRYTNTLSLPVYDSSECIPIRGGARWLLNRYISDKNGNFAKHFGRHFGEMKDFEGFEGNQQETHPFQ